MDEPDGIDEAVEAGLRAGLMAALRLGGQFARMHAESLLAMRHAEENRVRELRERFDAGRTAARAHLAPTARDGWWDTATPDMIRQALETATAWQPFDPAAAEAAGRIRDQVLARFGTDTDTLFGAWPGQDRARVGNGRIDRADGPGTVAGEGRQGPAEPDRGIRPAGNGEAAALHEGDRHQAAPRSAAVRATPDVGRPGTTPQQCGRAGRAKGFGR